MIPVEGGLPVLDPPVPVGPRRSTRPPLGLGLVAVAVGLLFAAPFAYVVSRTLQDPAGALDEVTAASTLEPLARTLGLAASVTLATAALGTALAWLTTRTDLPGRRFWRVVVPLPLVIPSFVGAAALVAAFARGGLLSELLAPLGIESLPEVRGFGAALVVLTLLCYPYVYLPVAARLASLPPSPEESARLLGRRPAAVFRTVVLPQTSAAVAAGALLVFLYVLSEFGAVSILRYDTLTRVIESAYSASDTGTAIPLSLLLGLLAVVVVGGERAVGRRRLGTEGARARRAHVVPLGRWRVPALVLAGGTVALALVAPIVVLAWWAVRGVTDLGVAVGDLASPALGTAAVGAAAAVVAVAVVLPVAQLGASTRVSSAGSASKRRGAVAEVPGALVVGGFALPGLVIALALAGLALALPEGLGLYQSATLLVLALVVHFGAQAMRAAQVAVTGVPRRLEDAARVLGAGRWRRLATVEVPVMLPGLLAGGGLVLLSVMKELPVTLLLRPTDFETLSTRIWEASENGSLGETGLASLVLLALSAVLTWALVVRRADRL